MSLPKRARTITVDEVPYRWMMGRGQETIIVEPPQGPLLRFSVRWGEAITPATVAAHIKELNRPLP